MNAFRHAAGIADATAHDVSRESLVVRPLESLADYQACVALQDLVWGPEFSERVPVSLLKVATYVGGLAIGAFDAAGGLVGLVFGLTGVHEGRVTHWSHMLAVHERARNLGVGRMLKEAQRAELARRGIPEMAWTFDPLAARNAHLNLNVLGARIVRFAPNMYGTTDSPLHHGLPTDRLVAAVQTAGASPPRRLEPGAATAPLLTLRPRPADPVLDRGGARPRAIRIEIPTDFARLLAGSPADAAAWHAATRDHFEWALAHGYEASGFVRDRAADRGFYALTRERSA